MDCTSCGTQIPPSFGHAIKKNECPACGSSLMDEESLALIEELRGFILQTVKVREETADVLALALIAAYSISNQNKAKLPLAKRNAKPILRKEPEEVEESGEIVKASDLFDPDNPISSVEREEILQERIETRLIAQNMIPAKMAARVVGSQRTLTDTEMAENPILEAQRLERLRKQEENMLNNPSSKCSVITRAS